MKTFPTTAGRLRSITTILRACGWGFCILAGIWLLWVTLSSPKVAISDAVLAKVQVTTQPGHPDAIAILASRSLQPEIHLAIVSNVPAAPPVRAPDLEVVATIVNPGQIPSAFVRSKKAKNMVTLQPGSQFEGATVKSITEQEVVLELQGHDFPIQVGRKGS